MEQGPGTAASPIIYTLSINKSSIIILKPCVFHPIVDQYISFTAVERLEWIWWEPPWSHCDEGTTHMVWLKRLHTSGFDVDLERLVQLCLFTFRFQAERYLRSELKWKEEERVCKCACVCKCARVCKCACVCKCARVSEPDERERHGRCRECSTVCAPFENLPGLTWDGINSTHTTG